MEKHRIPIFVSDRLRKALEKAAVDRRREKGIGRASITATVEEILTKHFFEPKKTIAQ